MSNRKSSATVLSLTIVTLSVVASARAATPCAELTALSLPEVTVTSARVIDSGAFAPASAPGRGARGQRPSPYAQLPAFCRVTLTATPSRDSDIKVEVWLPATGWNGRFQAVGDGALAGAIPYANMAPALAAGYATAGTDTGHVGNNADFMPGHPEKLVDFAHRATHVTAVAGKAVIGAFYGNAPVKSYYEACSGGGRQGLANAQRYPGDFDGIVAGAPSWDQARLDAARIGINLTVNRTPESRIPASKYPIVHDAVLRSCDGADGVKDGVIENPAACRFDYATLACKNGDDPTCLTAPQIESAKTLTSPFRNPTTGALILGSHLWPGTELQWGTLGGPDPLLNSVSRVRNFHLKDPAWEFQLSNVAADAERADRMDGGLLASNNFNLKPFFDRGGKLLMWHGWGDPQVPAQHSVIYYENVVKTVGRDADRSIALFMLPGVLHCSGGPGPDTFDKTTAIRQWVEQGQKPTRLIASRVTDGKIDRERPLCPLGQVAQYQGSGDTNVAANFSCMAESAAAARR